MFGFEGTKISVPCSGMVFVYLNILHSSLAQSVEHSAVNRSVVGSSPTGGASTKTVATVCNMAPWSSG